MKTGRSAVIFDVRLNSSGLVILITPEEYRVCPYVCRGYYKIIAPKFCGSKFLQIAIFENFVKYFS